VVIMAVPTPAGSSARSHARLVIIADCAGYRHLADLEQDAAGEPPGLLAVLGGVADPRHRRGVRHRLAVILGLAVCAVLAGARSFTAIAEWAADADAETLARLGATGAVPPESTFRRTLAAARR
jgi:hypothetical protein